MNRHTKPGFTLIELSIVLVIIGLIVGGVLVGRDLIAAATVRAQVTQIEKIYTAVNVFKGKYNAVPGDMNDNIAQQFGFANAPCGATTGRRDGDGQIQGGTGSTGNFKQAGGETALFWSDLSSAVAGNLIEGNFTAATCTSTPSVTTTQYSQYWPEAKIGRTSYIMPYFDLNTTLLNYLQVSKITSVAAGSISTTSAFTVNEAYSIEKKVDDGNGFTGRVLARNFTSPASMLYSGANCQDVSTGAYNLTLNNGNGVDCALSFLLQTQ